MTRRHDEAPSKVSRACFSAGAHWMSRWMDGRELLISIEAVCGLSKRRAKEAAALAGKRHPALTTA
jgi:hypothetical protein